MCVCGCLSPRQTSPPPPGLAPAPPAPLTLHSVNMTLTLFNSNLLAQTCETPQTVLEEVFSHNFYHQITCRSIRHRVSGLVLTRHPPRPAAVSLSFE